jgi:hypothetical protein
MTPEDGALSLMPLTFTNFTPAPFPAALLPDHLPCKQLISMAEHCALSTLYCAVLLAHTAGVPSLELHMGRHQVSYESVPQIPSPVFVIGNTH